MSPRSTASPNFASPKVARFPHQRLSDAELVAAIVQGDNAALGAVWDRYSPTVRAVLRASLGAHADCEDLLQEVFIAFLRGAARLRSADSLRGYLVGVAVRLVMGELRRRRVRRWVSLAPHEELAEAPAPHDDSDAAEVLRALYRLLDRMSPRRRLAFVLRYVQGMEVVEAARVLGVSDSTIKRESRRARELIFTRALKDEPRLWDYLQQIQAVIDHD
ncbi:MAG: sigma-70 family RNA polymerase sigma factor [Polyangiales bacterium]